jgi:methylated-DNA-[protein]-cysteine S-methyltransferase
VLDSPIGDLAVGADERGLCAVRFAPFDARAASPDGVPAGSLDRRLAAAAEQLRAYFAGQLTTFELTLSVPRGSAFERAVWAELSRIPYGRTRTYGEVAAAAGDPGAARAVGVACNRNPLPVVVPCHRVVGAGGKLVGFGGGLGRKRFLLELEAGVAMRSDWI